MNIIEDVTVGKISLVSKNKRPAVEKAESKFAIFKTFFQKKLVGEDQIKKLDEMLEKLKDIEKTNNN